MAKDITTSTNMETITSEDFGKLLKETYFKGAAEEIERSRLQEVEMKKTILESIIRAAAAGDISVKLNLPAYPSEKLTRFLKAANVTWIEESPRCGGFWLDHSITFTFFWTSLQDKLVNKLNKEK